MTPNDHEAGKVGELMPCPFCGATPHQGHMKLEYDQLHGEPFQRYRIWCPHGCAEKTGAGRETAITAWNRRAGSQTDAVAGDYFGNLVARARTAASKASAKYPQPNYIALKIAEESGEVVRGAVHYAEGRMEWSEVEGEIVQLLAMLFRFVTEGDQVIGVSPPTALEPTPIMETAEPATMTVDDLAQEIRRVDGDNSLGAGQLAEALMPFLAVAAGGEYGKSTPITVGTSSASPAVPADVQVVAWLDAGTAHEPWHRKIVATSPNYVENNGGLGKFEPLVRISDYQRIAAENERLRAERDEADHALIDKYRNPRSGVFSFPGDVAAIIRRLEAAESKLAEAVKELEWYGEQTRLCRLIHREGDAGRDALASDGGKRARTFITSLTPADGGA